MVVSTSIECVQLACTGLIVGVGRDETFIFRPIQKGNRWKQKENWKFIQIKYDVNPVISSSKLDMHHRKFHSFPFFRSSMREYSGCQLWWQTPSPIRSSRFPKTFPRAVHFHSLAFNLFVEYSNMRFVRND